MLKCEKYAKKIAEEMTVGHCEFIEKHILKAEDCGNIGCFSCKEKVQQWLLEEYVEPEIDWLKVPVDTPVLVRNSEYHEWEYKYFAFYLKEIERNYWCFSNTGKSKRIYSAIGWKYCKLAEGVDPTPYLKEV